MQKSCSYYRGIFYCPVATTGEYLRENHQFRVWELRKSNFLYFPFDRASWDKYMFNCNISMKFYDMSHFARSNGKETVQRAHCAMVWRRLEMQANRGRRKTTFWRRSWRRKGGKVQYCQMSWSFLIEWKWSKSPFTLCLFNNYLLWSQKKFYVLMHALCTSCKQTRISYFT